MNKKVDIKGELSQALAKPDTQWKTEKPEKAEYLTHSFRVRADQVQKLSYIALKTSTPGKKVFQKDLLEEALDTLIRSFEKKNGEIVLD